MNNTKVAIVTGGNRGLGKEACRQLALKGYQVVLTARDEAKGHRAARELTEALSKDPGVSNPALIFHRLDVADAGSVSALCRFVEAELGRADVLVNNAGVFLDRGGPEGSSALKTSADLVRKTFETNTLGPYQLCQQLSPLMKKHHYGRIVNVSSGMGQLSEMNGGWPAYRISKTALNAVTRVFAEELKGSGVLVNSACPGWVKTEMGGEGAELSIEEGVDTIVWLATLPDGGPSGGFFRERQPIAF